MIKKMIENKNFSKQRQRFAEKELIRLIDLLESEQSLKIATTLVI